MGVPAIRISSLCKRYRLGARSLDGYRTLRESIVNAVMSPFRSRSETTSDSDLWALKDVGFEVMPGEVVGIVGRNGAGKSTLLKILSRVTEPTSGRVEIRGRLGSLLEVGTGFHHELTGRENIFLNGAILGMSRREIQRRFDDIVNFAEIEQFLDTPVKRYSSGMYVRLAFSIAAHVEPEILIIDEVLAVGDAAFQNKCIGKTQEVARGGRTILLVSHQMDVVRRLCTRAVLLKQGCIAAEGDVTDVLNGYLAEGAGRIIPGQPYETIRIAPRGGTLDAVVAQVVCRGDGPAGLPCSEGSLTVEATIDVRRPVCLNSFCFGLLDRNRTRLLAADTLTLNAPPREFSTGCHTVSIRVSNVHLRPGLYVASICLANRPVTVFDHVEIGEIEIVPAAGREHELRPSMDGPLTGDVEWLN